MSIAGAQDSDIPSQAGSYALFDRISARYDLLNHLLSLGQDIRWRNRVASMIREVPHGRVLDIACGTCDMILGTLARNPEIQLGIGIDMAGRMLSIGKKKIGTRALDGRIGLIRGDGLRIPVKGDSFDVATVAFGIRNMPDPALALTEMGRALKPGGRISILEFSIPGNRLIRALYLVYFRHILPLVGRAISGDRDAYRYLNRSVESFPAGDDFCRLMEKAGFMNLQVKPLSFGIATIYCGDKP